MDDALWQPQIRLREQVEEIGRLPDRRQRRGKSTSTFERIDPVTPRRLQVALDPLRRETQPASPNAGLHRGPGGRLPAPATFGQPTDKEAAHRAKMRGRPGNLPHVEQLDYRR